MINIITQFTEPWKSIYVTSDSYAEYNKDSNVTKPKFKVGDHVRISKYKSIFAGYKDTLKIGQKFLLLAKLRIQFRGHVICDLNGEKIAGSFYEKELQKTSREKFRMEKVLKRTCDKLYVCRMERIQ